MKTVSKIKTTQILEDRWNRLGRYSFVVWTITEDGNISKKPVPIPGLKNFTNKDLTQDGVVLRIPPQSITMQTQFANSVIATNNGFLEENSGTVFRTIVISGTTGIWPDRSQATSPATGWDKVLSSVFPAAYGAAKNLVSSFNKTMSMGAKVGKQAGDLWKSAFGGAEEQAEPDPLDTKGSNVIGDETQTGYYQFWLLYNFFVEYTEFKKTKTGKAACLVFRNTKDNMDFAVTPISFDLRRDSRNPLLYNYSITLKAWSLAQSDWKNGAFNKGIDIRNPGFIKQILETIRRGRKTIQAAEGFLKGIQSDISDVINVVAQCHMAGKDAVGLGATLLDMPNVIYNNTAAIWAYNMAQMNGAVQAYGKAEQNILKSLGMSNKDPEQSASTATAAAGMTTDSATTSTGGTSTGGTSTGGDTASGSGSQTGGNTAVNTNPSGQTADTTSPGGAASAAAQIMAEILSNPEAADSINLSDLNLPPSIEAEIQKQIEAARQTSSGQVLEAAKKLQQLSDNIASQSGLLSNEYSKIYGVPASSGSSKTPTEDDIIMMANIQETVNSLIALTVSQDVFKEKRPDNHAPANEALPDSEQLPLPVSAYPIVVNRGDTLEKIAQMYLGDANRYREIAVLNNLRSPYIDEKGFTVPMNQCNLRKFIVKDKTNLAIAQKVIIYGDGISPSRRMIFNIEDINGSITITVSGAADLSKYTPSTNPYLFARTPGTVGPGDTILIPSPIQADQGEEPRPTPLLDRMSYAEKIFMVDVALNESTDLKIDPSGDVARSYGYTNAIQAIRLAIETEKGALQRHPNYGLPDIVGSMNTVISRKDIIDLIKKRVVSDPRFEDANVFVKIEGSVVRIKIEAYGSYGTGLIPIEFQVSI